jgi:hypothetical protein
MSGAYGMHGREKKCTLNLRLKTWRKMEDLGMN